jgi:hypothetical protein
MTADPGPPDPVTPARGTEAIVAELISAAEAVRTAMYNSDLEAAWRPEVERWDAAVDAASRAFPGIAPLLGD